MAAPTALQGKLEQATEATKLQIRPSVLTIFKEDALKRQLAVSIPAGSGLTVDRLLLVAFNEIRRNPDLGDCTRDSFVGALLQAARLGLEIGGPLGHFHLVPFRNSKINAKEVTPILGYKGMIVLARRSREITSIGARPWFANDFFEFSYGLEDHLVHRPPLDGSDRGQVMGFYGVARFVNGGVQPIVMSKKEVDSFRKRSKAAAASSGPWETDYEAMGAKTVIRRMAAFLPLTVEAATAIAEDEERDEGRTPEMANLDLSDFGITEEPKGKAAPRVSSESTKLEPVPPQEALTEAAPADSVEGQAAATEAPVPPTTSEPPAAEVKSEAEGGGPSASTTTCQICGLSDGKHDDAKHDDAKHAEWAKARRAEKKAEKGESLPLGDGS